MIRTSLDDFLVTIDTSRARCKKCIGYIDTSPSDDFCSEECQRAWFNADDIPDGRSEYDEAVRLRDLISEAIDRARCRDGASAYARNMLAIERRRVAKCVELSLTRRRA